MPPLPDRGILEPLASATDRRLPGHIVSTIRLIDIKKIWGTTVAVDNVSFTAAEGRFLVLLGPSGCGKSTTLRIIAGLEEVTAGKDYIGGDEVTEWAPSERRLSMVFQSYALFPHLDTAENILFVHQANGIFGDNRPRQGNPLPLPARQL